MGAPYSLDLRKKVVAKYKTGDISQNQLAIFFGLGVSTVKRYLRLEREKGDLSPSFEGKGRPSSIDEAGLQTVKKLIEENPTITLSELSQKYEMLYNKKVGSSVLSRACHRLKLFRKKLSIYASERDRDDVKKKDKSILRR
jgi:transposase